MSKRENLGESIRKERREKKRRFSYSKAYHRYFEGYSERVVAGSDGKTQRIERVYNGDYYRQDLPRKRAVYLRILYVFLLICAAYLFISGAVQPLAINTNKSTVFPQVLSLGFLFWTVITFFHYLPIGRKMTISEFRRSSRYLLLATLGGAISLGLAGVASLLFTLINPSDEIAPILLSSAKFLGAGLLILAMYLIERKVNYMIIPNPHKLSEESYPID